MSGILGFLQPPPASFPKTREHPLAKGEFVWCRFDGSPFVPDDVIDQLAGDGTVYLVDKIAARECFRTAIRNFDALHFQAILEHRRPAAYKASLKKTRPQLRRIASASGRAAEALRQISPHLGLVAELEGIAADPSLGLLGHEPMSKGRGRQRKALADLLFGYLVILREEAGGAPPSATWRRQEGTDGYRDVRFATFVADLLSYLPRLQDASSLPDHLRVPLSPKAIASRISELKYPRHAGKESSEKLA